MVGRDIVAMVRHVEGVVAVHDRLSYPPAGYALAGSGFLSACAQCSASVHGGTGYLMGLRMRRLRYRRSMRDNSAVVRGGCDAAESGKRGLVAGCTGNRRTGELLRETVPVWAWAGNGRDTYIRIFPTGSAGGGSSCSPAIVTAPGSGRAQVAR